MFTPLPGPGDFFMCDNVRYFLSPELSPHASFSLARAKASSRLLPVRGVRSAEQMPEPRGDSRSGSAGGRPFARAFWVREWPGPNGKNGVLMFARTYQCVADASAERFRWQVFSLRHRKIANRGNGRRSGQFSLGFRGFCQRRANLRDSKNRQIASLKPFRLFSTEPAAFGFAYKLLRLFKRLKI
jgi:hypothetical protein